MKVLKQFKLIILPILMLLFSCNFGSSSGDDLVGKWKASNDEYITFCDDQTGYYEHYTDNSDQWRYKNFEWDVEYDGVNKNLILSGEFHNQYQYYFSNDYNSLYLKQHDKPFYQEWHFFRKK